jgi:hypothetical protein
MGAGSSRDWGLPYGANVVLPKQLLLESRRRGDSEKAGDGCGKPRETCFASWRTSSMKDTKGVGWTIFKAGRQLDQAVRNTVDAWP